MAEAHRTESLGQHSGSRRSGGDGYVVAMAVLASYCRALDLGAPDALRDLLHEDVMLDLGHIVHHGRAAVLDSYAGFFAARDRTTRHHVTNVRVLEHRPGRVDADAYVLVVTEKAGIVSLASGTYRDTIVLADDRWQISYKRIDLDVPFTRLVTPDPSVEGAP